MINSEFYIILSTCPDAETAARIARALLEESLVACVNIVPGLRSMYRWNDSIQDEQEVLMILKTTVDRLPDARQRLVALHPYEVPEVVALPVADGHDAYLSWVFSATRAPTT
jgi:periplasmic divalent cation tolerance protein